MTIWVFFAEIAGRNKLKLSLLGEFAEGYRVHGISLEKMGKTVAMMQRFEGSNVISTRILVLRKILQRKLEKQCL